MEVNRLLKDELLYELHIRGVSGNRDITVAELRQNLRDILRTERNNRQSLILLDIEIIFKDEMELCKVKLSEVEQAIENFDNENAENDYRRINTRLQHLIGRVNRITGSNDEEEEERLLLVAACQNLQKELSSNLERSFPSSSTRSNTQRTDRIETGLDTNGSILDLPVDEILPEPMQRSHLPNGLPTTTQGDLIEFPGARPTFRANESNFLPVTTTYRTIPTSVNPQVHFSSTRDELTNMNNVSRLATLNSSTQFWDRPDYLSNNMEDLHFSPVRQIAPKWREDFRGPDISKWNVKFNGRTSVNEFIERIEELRVSRGASYQQLLRCAPEILTQDALLWYRTKKFSSWLDLVSHLKEAYLPYDYEISLMDEIRKRTQGSQEKVLTYITIMENLFKKLKQPPREIDRVALIKRNLLPEIQSHLALNRVSTVDDLICLSRAVEETQARIQKYVPPPTSNRSLLEPELAYKKPSGQTSVLAFKSQNVSSTPAKRETNPSQSISNSTLGNSPSCWNCGSTSHRFKKCDKPRSKRFCFKCGENNVSIYNCPNCRKNSNRSQQ